MIFEGFLVLRMKMNDFKLKLNVKGTYNCPRLENALQPLFRVYGETIYDKTNEINWITRVMTRVTEIVFERWRDTSHGVVYSQCY